MQVPGLSEQEYLRQVELLAIDVVSRARAEGWLSYQPDPDDATALQRAVNELARRLRHHHFDGDGCIDNDQPILRLAGAALLMPGRAPNERESYHTRCTELGVDTRDEGWALWHTWDNHRSPYTLITTVLATTRGLLDNWSRGRDVHPTRPYRAQIAAIVSDWTPPMTVSPGYAAGIGLRGR